MLRLSPEQSPRGHCRCMQNVSVPPNHSNDRDRNKWFRLGEYLVVDLSKRLPPAQWLWLG
jgi:hypothetical protein